MYTILWQPKVAIITTGDHRYCIHDAIIGRVYREWRYNMGEGCPHAESIIVFRDGLSEGSFQHCLDVELEGLRRACLEIDPQRQWNPRIAWHHARFFPTDARDADRNGNCRVGTVIDTDVVNKEWYDFYPYSHAGIQDTSRPSKYTVLIDENGIDLDALQAYVLRLAHGYARCNRLVSITSVVYYAHLLALRGVAYLDTGYNDEIEVRKDLKHKLYFV